MFAIADVIVASRSDIGSPSFTGKQPYA
jgi:hypothetical protein